MHPHPKLPDCWAKTDRETGVPSLSVRDHCLYVGAVASRVIDLLPSSLKRNLPEGAATLIAMHDIGKITLGFQKKCPGWQFFPKALSGSEPNHSKVSQAYFSELISQIGAPRTAGYWGIALGGHHGKYHSCRPVYRVEFELESDWADGLREELVSELASTFGGLPNKNNWGTPTFFQIHWFTGAMTFSDWIGSNEEFFPLHIGKPLQNRATTSEATEKAESALRRINWGETRLFDERKFSSIFPFSPNHLQQAMINACEYPGLYIVEATMGLGKTEAALAAAYARWRTGEENGLYFALPTQLTSNRIFDRIRPFLEKTVESLDVTSLVHSNSWLNGAQSFQVNTSDNESLTETVSEAERWFSSSRTAMLSTFGVGTIDQALMAVLSVKHSSVRFFSLAGKTVILDEVHSFDPYTFSLICRLVRELVEIGSTVIILSATLTSDARKKLVEAAGGDESVMPKNYPLITSVLRSNGNLTRFHSITPSTPSKEFRLRHCEHSPDSPFPRHLLHEIVEAAQSGACVLIIRNTVREAQELFGRLATKLTEDIPMGLLHSRFPQFRRDELEDTWVGRLDKKSGNRPAGCVLVSTQIVEQSVDIDADLLVTDLAPSELILQRLGRLHRHERERPNQFSSPMCWILHPSISEREDAKILKKQLGPSAFVYPPPTLVRSSEILRKRDSINLPDDIRSLIEDADSKTSLPSPAEAALIARFEEEIEKMKATAKVRSHNPLDPNALIDDENRAQTRWGIKRSYLIVLLRSKPERIGTFTRLQLADGSDLETDPDQFDFSTARAVNRNAIKIPNYLIREFLPGHWLSRYFFDPAFFAVLEHEIAGSCEFPDLDPDSLDYDFHYCYNRGLTWVRRKDVQIPPDFEEVDGWY